jgi:hypothetical protein
MAEKYALTSVIFPATLDHFGGSQATSRASSLVDGERVEGSNQLAQL